jgi:hypothetical protein
MRNPYPMSDYQFSLLARLDSLPARKYGSRDTDRIRIPPHSTTTYIQRGILLMELIRTFLLVTGSQVVRCDAEVEIRDRQNF